jgi:hypothetical protein
LNGGDELVIRGFAGGQFDEVGNVTVAQAGERKAFRHGLPGELGQSCRQWVAQTRVDVPVGADDEQAAFAELARE